MEKNDWIVWLDSWRCHSLRACVLSVSVSVLSFPSLVDLLSQARKCHNDWCCTITWLCTKRQTDRKVHARPPSQSLWGGGLHVFWSAANKTVADSHVCKLVWRGPWRQLGRQLTCCGLQLLQSPQWQVSGWPHSVHRSRDVSSCSVHSGIKTSLWPCCDWPSTCLLQGELGAEEGEVKGCCAMPTWEGVRGVLRAGPGATPAPQCQLQPGQGLDNEAHHQLPAHEETAQYRSVT